MVKIRVFIPHLDLKEIFENENILKCGYKQKEEYMLLWKNNIDAKNLVCIKENHIYCNNKCIMD